jgi:hypothetical protein
MSSGPQTVDWYLSREDEDDVHACDPGIYFDSCESLGLDTESFWGKVNSFTCPRGKAYGHGYLLIAGDDLSTLDFGVSYTLKVSGGGNNLTFDSIFLVRATSLNGDLTGGGSVLADNSWNDGTSSIPGTSSVAGTSQQTMFLVEICDVRKIMAASEFAVPPVPHFNVRGTSYLNLATGSPYIYPDPDAYLYNSVDESGDRPYTAYTWQTCLDTIWENFTNNGSTVGDVEFFDAESPDLPYTPAGAPENLAFYGWSAWDAYHFVLEKLCCSLLYDPTTGEFSIIQIGTVQSSLSLHLAANEPNLLDHNETQYGTTTIIPSVLRVYFRSQSVQYGQDIVFTDYETNDGSFQEFEAQPYWMERRTISSDDNAMQKSAVVIWDDMLALVAINYGSTINILNQTAITAKADELKTNYQGIFTNSLGWLSKTYLGFASDVLAGSQIERVTWADFGDSSGTGGAVTILETQPLTDYLPASAFPEPGGASTFTADDFKLPRNPFPDFPPTDQLVGSLLTGSDFPQPNSEGLTLGNLLVVDANASTLGPSATGQCWIWTQPAGSPIPPLATGRYCGLRKSTPQGGGDAIILPVFSVTNTTGGVALVVATAAAGIPIGLPCSVYGSCVYAGVVRSILTTAPTMCNDTGGNRLDPSTLPVPPEQTCWIVVTDFNQGFGAVTPTLIKGEPMIGVLVQPYTVGTTTLPLYWVKKGQQTDTVQITGTAGATVTAGTGGVLPVTVQDFTAGATLTDFTSGSPMTAGVSAWLAFVDNPGGSFQAGATAIGGDNYQAQLCLASFTPSGGTNKRLYLCRKGGTNKYARIIYGTLYATLTAGGSCLCTVTQYDDGPDPGSPVTVYTASGSYGFTGVATTSYFKAHYRPEDGKYYFDWVSCAP